MSDIFKRVAELSPEKKALLALRLKEGKKLNSFPLSFAQERLWFLDQMEPGNPTYNMPAAVLLKGKLDISALEQSFTELIRRHEILRTTFITVEGRPAQVVAPSSRFTLTVSHMAEVSNDKRESELLRLTTEEAHHPFDLSVDQPLRAKLLQLNDEEHILLVTIHHIVGDGWSMGILIREVATLYDSYSRGQKSPLPELQIQYADFAVWQRGWMKGDVLENQLKYWKEQLGNGELSVLNLPTDKPRPFEQTHDGSAQSFALPVELTKELKDMSQREGVTLFMLLLAAFKALLYRYTDQEDLLVGTPIANRNRRETEDLIGFFVNTLVLRSNVRGDISFMDLLQQVRKVSLEAYAHQDLPFEKLVDELQPERRLGTTPLFQVLFALQNAPAGEIGLSELVITPLRHETKTTHFDLSMAMAETESELVGTLEYSTKLFYAETIKRMLGHFEMLLTSIVKNPDQNLADLTMLTDTERRQILLDWQGEYVDYSSQPCISRIFENQVESTPEALAVVFNDESLNYSELNKRANRLARHLRSLGVGPEVCVGVCVERSIDVVVAMLATFKAGGAYLPLDPDYPQERLAFMLEDAQVGVVLTHEQLLDVLPQHNAQIVSLNSYLDEITQQSEENLSNEISGDSLAYVIYTSGTTGKPKAVMVEHGNLANIILASRDRFNFDSNDVMPAIASFSFDISLFEILTPLSSGATSIILTREHVLDIARLANSLSQFTLVHAVPSLMRQLVNFVRENRLEKSAGQTIRALFTGGDLVPVDLLFDMQRVFRSAQTYVLYGPTEGTIICSNYELQSGVKPENHIIGKPFSNVTLRVFDKAQNLVPVGISGDLYIGGANVTRGYLNRDELTKEKYVEIDNHRFYKTGDLVRYLPDGNLEFLGRSDQQVKIRGFRIELEEVETTLGEHPGIREVVVVARDDGNEQKYLAAYYVPESNQSLAAAELRGFIKKKLPEYMIPSAFVALEALPLTRNGKVDRKSLPQPERAHSGREQSVAPRTPTEKILAEVWSQILGIEHVGIHDNFFELGGDSILSIQIVAKANRTGCRITPKQMLQHQTIAELAAVVGAEQVAQAEQAIESGSMPLTPIQQWFFEQGFNNPHHFNQAVMLESAQALDPDLLKQAVKQLLAHHDSLRLRFINDDAGWHQAYSDISDDVPFALIEIQESQEAEQQSAIEKSSTALQSTLNLSEGPLIRVALFRPQFKGPCRLLLIIHHLVTDGVSWRILLEDLQTAYQQLSEGKKVELAPKTSSFKQWANKLIDHAQSETVQQQINYWLAEHKSASTRLPVDFDAEDNTIASVRTVSASISASETQALLHTMPEIFQTQINEVLFTALCQSLSRWAGSHSILVNLEGHGREDIFNDIDISRTVGWFTTLFPVLIDLQHIDTPAAALRLVKEKLRSIPDRGIGYGLLALNSNAAVAEQLRLLPAAEVSFNYLGQFDHVLSSNSPFTMARESVGVTQDPKQKRTHLLDVTALVANGQLNLSWTYSENVHQQSTIEQLSEDVIHELRKLIAQTQSPDTDFYTPSDFPLAGLNRQTLNQLVNTYPGIEDIYPLPPIQQGLLFHARYASDPGLYFVQMVCTLSGKLNVSAFKRAWQHIVNRHPILRTAFIWEGLAEPLQIVSREVSLPFEELDWQHLSEAEQQERLQSLLIADRDAGFDLTKAPLMRVTLIQKANECYELVWSHHHLLLDGWSLPLVLKELFDFYEAFCRNEHVQLDSTTPYRNYVAWLQQQDLSSAETFWKRHLAGFTSPTPISRRAGDISPIPESTSEQQLSISTGLTASIESFARQHHLTIATILEGVWAMLLSRYSGEDDVVFGVTSSGRPAELPQVESIIGLFINTLPIRVQMNASDIVPDWLKRLQDTQLEARQYEYSPLAQVQTWSNVPRDLPLFESILVFENYPVEPALSQQRRSLDISNIRPVEKTNYPLILAVMPGTEMLLRVIYDDHRFGKSEITRMLGHLQTLLESLVNEHDQPISSLNLLTEAERNQLLVQWNTARADYFKEASLIELFEKQVEKSPNAIAVSFEENKLKYHELNQRANQLAHHLRSMGAKPDMLIGICVERSVEMIIGILGILKAGGAYVPLDLSYPKERLAFILEDAHVPILLAQKSVIEKLPEHNARIVCLDAEEAIFASESDQNPDSCVSADNLAYVIYTSGSTGKPKGVLIPHSNVVRLFEATRSWFHFDENDVWTLFHSYAFDFSVWELWGPLLYGGRLVVVPYWVSRSAESFHNLLCEERVTVLNQTPSAFRELIRADQDSTSDQNMALRFVIFGGEALELQMLKPWFDRHGDSHPKLVNMYGITETTVHVTYRLITMADVNEASGSVIGQAIPDLQLYILDKNMRPAPIGIPGEIYVGGAGLARGYLNRPALTLEKFVAHPFSNEPGTRLYKTGDTARYLENGDIEYNGRIDNQIKIRGFRVELGEIESAIVEFPELQTAIVIAREDTPGDKRLIAYVVGDQTQHIAINDLKDYLKEKLPEYMVPSAFVVLTSIPLTPNGKVDYKALPEPERGDLASVSGYVAPRTIVEEALADMWSEVLGVDQVGVYDDFFDLGGHSLMAMHLVTRLVNTFHSELPLRSFFEAATIAEIAKLMIENEPKPGQTEKIAQVLKKIRNTPVEERKKLLEERRNEKR